MVFIQIHAKNEQNWNEILDWMIEELYRKSEVSLIDLFRRYYNEVIIEDDDILSYYDIGWNELDLHKLYKAKCDHNNLEIPKPKCYFMKRYT